MTDDLNRWVLVCFVPISGPRDWGGGGRGELAGRGTFDRPCFAAKVQQCNILPNARSIAYCPEHEDLIWDKPLSAP